MSRFGTSYQVARATGVCAATGEPLEPGSPCVATLCERPEDDGFDRKDFAPAAWESGARPDGLFSYWRTSVPDRNESRRMLLDDAVLMDLFERLADDERPQRVAFRLKTIQIGLERVSLTRSVGDADIRFVAGPDQYPGIVGESRAEVVQVDRPHVQIVEFEGVVAQFAYEYRFDLLGHAEGFGQTGAALAKNAQ